MKAHNLFCATMLFSMAWITGAASPAALAQDTVPVHTIVTATAKSQGSVDVSQQSVSVSVDKKPQQVSGWIPLNGRRQSLDLVLLLDDSSRTSLGLHLNELKSFIGELPPGTRVAVGYMRNGSANLVQGFTPDRNAAVNALRMPMGAPGENASPYFCLSDLVKHWPAGTALRREVVMVTNGVDNYSGLRYDPENPYVQTAISDTQKAGVIVYSIYFSGAGRIGRGGMGVNSGQNYLLQVSENTGGQAYFQGFGNPVSFTPFLSDIQRRLQNQYELSFSAPPKKGLQALSVKTNQPNVKLDAPAKIFTGGAGTER